MHHGLDNDNQVFFYEQEFYVLSNFSAFKVQIARNVFMTAEHAYHFEKFVNDQLKAEIKFAWSAHEAFQRAQAYKAHRRPDWDAVKVEVMKKILWAKVDQHSYVRKKLLETGERQLVENSWRDDYWGWGENKNGQNMLGKLWMGIRDELRGFPSLRLRAEADQVRP